LDNLDKPFLRASVPFKEALILMIKVLKAVTW